MTSKLVQQIENRGNEIANEKIKAFRHDIGKAFQRLLGGHRTVYCATVYSDIRHGDAPYEDSEEKQVLECLLSGGYGGWPERLWTEAVQNVTDEIMGIMDPMTRSLEAGNPKADDYRPASNKEATQ